MPHNKILNYVRQVNSNKINVNTGTCDGTFWIRCEAINSCGASSYSLKLFRVSNNSGGGPCNYSLTTYPNPVKKGGVTINLVMPPPCYNSANSFSTSSNELNIPSLDQMYNIEIYDNAGNPVCNESSKGVSHFLNISDLKKGIYYIKAHTINGRTYQQRIIKD